MRRSRLLLGLLATWLAAPGCASTPPPETVLARMPRQDVGQVFAGGLMELTSIDESGFDEGLARFRVRGLRDGGEPVHQSVIFVWIPGDRADHDRVEAGFAQVMPPAAGEEITLVAKAPDDERRRAAGQRLARAELKVVEGLLVPTVARRNGVRGSTYLNGALECVGLDWDSMDRPQRLTIGFENVTQSAIDDAEYLVALLVRDRVEVDRTGWLPLPPVPVNGRVRVDVPLDGRPPGHSFGLVVRRLGAAQPR